MKKILVLFVLLNMLFILGCSNNKDISGEFLPGATGTIAMKIRVKTDSDVFIQGDSSLPSRLIISVYKKEIYPSRVSSLASESISYTEVLIRQTTQNLVWDSTKGTYNPVYGTIDSIPSGNVRVLMQIEEFGVVTYSKSEYVDVIPGTIAPLNNGNSVTLSFTRTEKKLYFVNHTHSGYPNDILGIFKNGFMINGVSGKSVEAATTLTVISSSSTGQFSLDGETGWSSSINTVLSAGVFYSTYYYKDSTPGTHTLTASVSGWQSATQQVTINTQSSSGGTTGYYSKNLYKGNGAIRFSSINESYNVTVNYTQSADGSKLSGCVFLWRPYFGQTYSSLVPRYEVYNASFYDISIPENYINGNKWLHGTGVISQTGWRALHGGIIPSYISSLTVVEVSKDILPTEEDPYISLKDSENYVGINGVQCAPVIYQNAPVISANVTGYTVDSINLENSISVESNISNFHYCGLAEIDKATAYSSSPGIHPELSYSIETIQINDSGDRLSGMYIPVYILDENVVLIHMPMASDTFTLSTNLENRVYWKWNYIHSTNGGNACMYLDKSTGALRMGFFAHGPSSNIITDAEYLAQNIRQ